MRAVLNTCIIMLFANVIILLGLYGSGSAMDGPEATQSLNRLISAYSEPSSNPQFLVRDENQCRFWTNTVTSGYCARALAKRRSITAAYAFNPALPEVLQSTPNYAAYVGTRKDLMIATTEYVAFLAKNPKTDEYVNVSKQFEEQSQVLVGQLISYLYAMQSQNLAKQSGQTQNILMLQYFCLVAVLFLICLLRFRKGNTTNG